MPDRTRDLMLHERGSFLKRTTAKTNDAPQGRYFREEFLANIKIKEKIFEHR